MGVGGLLPLLKSIQRPAELKKFSGQTLGVDTYVWLHGGAFSCASALAQGKPTRAYVNYTMHKVRMLQHFGITPYMVLDGAYLPSKAGTEASRAKNREESRRRGMELLKAGKAKDAEKEFQKCVDVTPEMARHLIEDLKKHKVAYVVAPYEADAQLVYLERQGLIDGIISEDSDLLVFGARRLITKLSKFGECIEINRRDFGACREVSLTGWTDTDFRRMAIMSGCDYLSGIPYVGLKTAHRLLRKYKTPERVVKMLQFEGKHTISENYLTEFYRAELTFLHQRVYCPKKQELVLLTESRPDQGIEDMPFIGAAVEPAVARAVAVGDLNPITKEPIEVVDLSPSKRRHSQSAHRQLAPRPSQPTGKPINSYFKDKNHGRIPMGEMDRNCFSVDPQRVAEITHNGLVPRVFPLPRPYIDQPASRPDAVNARRVKTSGPSPSAPLLRRRTEPIAKLLSPLLDDEQSNRRRSAIFQDDLDPEPVRKEGDDLRAAVDLLMTGNSHRPAKKLRLCADLDKGNDSKEAETSKWFAKMPAKKTEGYLFSDNSLDEALMELPDLDGWQPSQSRESISVFEESQITTTTTTTESQISTKDSQEPDTPLTQTSLWESDTASKAEFSQDMSQDLGLGTPLRTSISQFSYKRRTTRSTTRNFAARPTPSTAGSHRTSGIFTPMDSVASTAASSVATRPTSLQRMGAQACRGRALPGSPVPSYKAKLPPFRVPKGIPVNPSFVPLPKVDVAEVEALNRPCGSEDQFGPETEEHDEDPEADGVEKPEVQRVNFSRFAFSLEEAGRRKTDDQ